MARRKKRQNLHKAGDAVALPPREDTVAGKPREEQTKTDDPASETSTIAAPSEPETPATSQAPSESDFTQVSTPATPAQAPTSSPKITSTQKHGRRDTRTAIAVPNIPGVGKPKTSSPATEQQAAQAPSVDATTTPTRDDQTEVATSAEQLAAEQDAVKSPPKPVAPKSWADLVRAKNAANAPAAKANGSVIGNGMQLPKSASLAEALRQYSAQGDASLPFLEPRGLVNTGNMCYMNSVSLFA